MKKLSIIVLILLTVFIAGCSKKEEKKEVSDIDKKVEETLKDMTLDEKIGQMMIIYYRKDSVDATLKSALDDIQPGGFIMFKENITNYERTLNFIKEIKTHVDIPMFISIDEEGGRVQRLQALYGDVATDVPSMYDVGLKDDTELTYEVGKVIAEELRVFGFNMDFAPVIDVYSNPDNTVIGKRSFGTTAELVTKHGEALAKGLEDNGVLSVYKHFPGHGNTATDSHYALPIVDKTKEELLELDLKPFIDVINNGAKIIMVGHLAVPSIAGDNTPTSLSKELITDFLKGELGYKNLVITDALDMGALTNYFSEDEICGKAVEAGVDILLMPKSSRSCLKSVKTALENGSITEEQINESVRKILKLKYEYIEDNYDKYLDKSYLNSSEHQEIIDKIK